MRSTKFVPFALLVSACALQRPVRALNEDPLTSRSIARAADDDPSVRRAIRCANELLRAIPPTTNPPRSPVRPFAVHRFKDARAADAGLPLAVPTGFAAHQVAREWTLAKDPRVGRWIALPLNMEFAMDTFTTTLELAEFYPRLATAARADRTEMFIAEFAIARRFAEALADDYYFDPPADARALLRFLSIRYFNRGRRFHCYDEDGRDLWASRFGATNG